jgi:hypothetical protein
MLKKGSEMNNDKDRYGRINRRSLVKNGTTLIGAGFLGSFAAPPVEPPEKAGNNVFNVRDFGATGNKGDNATIPVRSAIDACTAAGGGKVYVPPGDYTVGTLQLKNNVNLIRSGSNTFLFQMQLICSGSRNDLCTGCENIAVTEEESDGLAKYEFVEMRNRSEIANEIESYRKRRYAQILQDRDGDIYVHPNNCTIFC